MTEDYKQKELNRLHRLLCEKEKEFEKAKTKRNIITILCFAIFYFWVLWFFKRPAGWYILGEVVIALVLAGIHFFVNAIVFSTLTNKSRGEEEYLKHIQKQIDELKKTP